LKVSFFLSGFLPVKRGVSCILSLELLDMGWKMILPIWMVEAATCLQTNLYKYHIVEHIPIIYCIFSQSIPHFLPLFTSVGAGHEAAMFGVGADEL